MATNGGSKTRKARSSKKSASKKTGSKKTSSKKSASRKTASKKSASKKTTSKKGTTKKAGSKKSASRKIAAKKTGTGKRKNASTRAATKRKRATPAVKSTSAPDPAEEQGTSDADRPSTGSNGASAQAVLAAPAATNPAPEPLRPMPLPRVKAPPPRSEMRPPVPSRQNHSPGRFDLAALETYLRAFPREHPEIVDRLRRLVKTAAAGAGEAIKWAQPVVQQVRREVRKPSDLRDLVKSVVVRRARKSSRPRR